MTAYRVQIDCEYCLGSGMWTGGSSCPACKGTGLVDATPHRAADPYAALPQPNEESRERLDAAEQAYVDDDEDYALDRFIATVFRIGYEQAVKDA